MIPNKHGLYFYQTKDSPKRSAVYQSSGQALDGSLRDTRGFPKFFTARDLRRT